MKQTSSVNRACPACGANDSDAWGEKNGFQIISCKKCGTLFTSNLPAPSDATDYDSYGPEKFAVTDFVQARLDEIVSDFSSYKQNNRLLDVGCCGGALMQAALRAGWDAQGMDVSQPAIDHARKLGLKVFQGELQQADYPDEHFDVITCSEVLEHVPDPHLLVQEIARILRPGGLVWMTTPHGKGLSARLIGADWSVVCPPTHLQLFTAAGLKSVFSTAGFCRVRVTMRGTNPHEIRRVIQSRRAKNVKCAPPGGEKGDGDVTTCQLNEVFSATPWRRSIKNLFNSLLSVTTLGDGAKVWAEK